MLKLQIDLCIKRYHWLPWTSNYRPKSCWWSLISQLANFASNQHQFPYQFKASTSPLHKIIQKLKQQLNNRCIFFSGLSELSNGELLDLKQEMAAYVKEYSDILVEELTLREELDREKEIKNNFISTLLAVQSKIRESQTGQGKGKKGSSAYSGKVSESWSKEQYCLSQDVVTLDVDHNISNSYCKSSLGDEFDFLRVTDMLFYSAVIGWNSMPVIGAKGNSHKTSP